MILTPFSHSSNSIETSATILNSTSSNLLAREIQVRPTNKHVNAYHEQCLCHKFGKPSRETNWQGQISNNEDSLPLQTSISFDLQQQQTITHFFQYFPGSVYPELGQCKDKANAKEQYETILLNLKNADKICLIVDKSFEKLVDIPPSVIHLLKSAKDLYLSGIKVTPHFFAHLFGEGCQIEGLQISDCSPIVLDELLEFGEKLQYLSLSNTPVVVGSRSSACQASYLRIVQIANCLASNSMSCDEQSVFRCLSHLPHSCLIMLEGEQEAKLATSLRSCGFLII